jgi:hypothetical protein
MKLFKGYSNNFTQITNELINDDKLSYGAKGLYMYLVSKPDGWNYYIDDMVKHSKNSKYKVQQFIKELESVGYLERKASKDDKGKLKGWDYFIYAHSTRQHDIQTTANSDDGKNRQTGNQTHSNTNNTNTKKDSNTNKDIEQIEKEVEKLYQDYPRKKGKARGIKKAITLIKNNKITLNDLKKSINNYAVAMANQDEKFIKHFSTFMNGDYEDYLYEEKEEIKTVDIVEDNSFWE